MSYTGNSLGNRYLLPVTNDRHLIELKTTMTHDTSTYINVAGLRRRGGELQHVLTLID